MKDKKLKLNGRSSHDQFESFRLESDMKREQAKALELGTVSRNWTLAIAVPGSLLNNAPSLEMKTYIVGNKMSLTTWCIFFPHAAVLC